MAAPNDLLLELAFPANLLTFDWFTPYEHTHNTETVWVNTRKSLRCSYVLLNTTAHRSIDFSLRIILVFQDGQFIWIKESTPSSIRFHRRLLFSEWSRSHTDSFAKSWPWEWVCVDVAFVTSWELIASQLKEIGHETNWDPSRSSTFTTLSTCPLWLPISIRGRTGLL